MIIPDIQLFTRDGTWEKPSGAVRSDVLLQGAGGAACGLTAGQDGGLACSSFAAEILPDSAQVTIGRGGSGSSPGMDGYALVVTWRQP